MRQIYNGVLGSLEKQNSYERVFALRSYGYTLARNQETRLEGNDYIDQATALEKGFPFWSERKMNLFVPVMALEDNV